MDKHEQLGPWVRRFLFEHLIRELNLSPNTQRSYRTTLAMLLPFIAAQLKTPLDCLEVNDLSADRVRQFLTYLEQTRQVSVRTRNQRLAAIHSLARFIAECSPQHVAWYGAVRTVPFKKTIRKLIPYLEKPEVEALLAIPDRTTKVGRRNYALLLFLYNSGARVSDSRAPPRSAHSLCHQRRHQTRCPFRPGSFQNAPPCRTLAVRTFWSWRYSAPTHCR